LSWAANSENLEGALIYISERGDTEGTLSKFPGTRWGWSPLPIMDQQVSDAA
jgi:hypothetical protein